MSEVKKSSEISLQPEPTIRDLYEDWFLDYASYVILERAIPAIEDGLKPVHRRILHAMKEMDDGRFNKVANIIGFTMQFHPHGDASINDALVNLGQKDLLVETQGNWGDFRTGDRAAASRYIEARLSKFAHEVLFNKHTTPWTMSYDGRKREPIHLPAKFPLLLYQGVEGIAVGLSTRILPHNFTEIIESCIKHLRKEEFTLFPDFPTGGKVDVGDYQEGARGGRVKIRSTISIRDSKTLIIHDIPYSATTTSLIESILKANENGKIRIKQVVDNTASTVEILVHLASGVSPTRTIQALYAFTDCEKSIATNACIIREEKPVFLGVNDFLRSSVDLTKELHGKELDIEIDELREKILFSSLEKIFIENKIYRKIEECLTWESVLETIDRELEPFKEQFYREIRREDIVSLTEIRIKRISKYDVLKTQELIRGLEGSLKKALRHRKSLVAYTIDYYSRLLETYGKGKERKTKIVEFGNIQASVVAARNVKLYVNRKDGFVGHGLKKEEYLLDCSDLDDILVIRRDGIFSVAKIQEKNFMGKGITHVAVFKKEQSRLTYNLVYLDGATRKSMVKRFNITAVIKDREYTIAPGGEGSRILYLTANPNGEAERIKVTLDEASKARKKEFDFDFSDIGIKGRGSRGNTLTSYKIRSIKLEEGGASTLKGLEAWYEESTGTVNVRGKGRSLGFFDAGEQFIVISSEGSYMILDFDPNLQLQEDKVLILRKYDPQAPVTAVYYNPQVKTNMIKKFLVETTTLNKPFKFIPETGGAKLFFAGIGEGLHVTIRYRYRGMEGERNLELSKAIETKGWKAMGNRFIQGEILEVTREKRGEEQKMLNDLKEQIRREVKKETLGDP